MMRHPNAIIAIAGLSAAAAVGGLTVALTTGGSTAATPPPLTLPKVQAASSRPTAPVRTATVPTATTIRTAKATVGGATETILVNGKGLPLYFYKPDTATRSMVTGGLATFWPPLDTVSPTEQGATGTLHVVNTSNGSQVTYNGHFLYTLAEDSPGQVTGQ